MWQGTISSGATCLGSAVFFVGLFTGASEVLTLFAGVTTVSGLYAQVEYDFEDPPHEQFNQGTVQNH